ncbi:hypothetical protein [Haloarchaeobius sp. HRN-SO-5]|uniref:hypothetical protein n=1 Tax=Haloarchaeobius sp. HRN-SO-5 TaxID=3446118 RepID=UPI003EBA47D4
MATQLRVLDDGAWISVDNRRRVPNSDVWPLAATDFCACETAHVVLEAFTDVGVGRDGVAVSAVGQCIDCGTAGSLDWLPVGRIRDGEFHAFDPGTVRATLEPGRNIR